MENNGLPWNISPHQKENVFNGRNAFQSFLVGHVLPERKWSEPEEEEEDLLLPNRLLLLDTQF
eukprot:scaffold3243_cov173-Ochromonas_danica.AAC.8